MDTFLLKLYMHENRYHNRMLLHEWILRNAKNLGIDGATVLHGIAGYGRNGVLHEQHFMELAGSLPVQVELTVGKKQADDLLTLLSNEKVSIMYVKIPVNAGYVVGDF